MIAFELLSKDGNITPEKAHKSRQMQFRDKTAYVWGLRYRWYPSLSRNPVPALYVTLVCCEKIFCGVILIVYGSQLDFLWRWKMPRGVCSRQVQHQSWSNLAAPGWSLPIVHIWDSRHNCDDSFWCFWLDNEAKVDDEFPPFIQIFMVNALQGNHISIENRDFHLWYFCQGPTYFVKSSTVDAPLFTAVIYSSL